MQPKVWSDIRSFEDLCQNAHLILTDRSTPTTMTHKNIKCHNDLAQLNQLGFLTTDSQIGCIEVCKKVCTENLMSQNADIISIPSSVPANMMRCEQKNYIEGFMKKSTLHRILKHLDQYIVYIHTTNSCEDQTVHIVQNYSQKYLSFNGKILFLPKKYTDRIDTSYHSNLDYVYTDNQIINLKKYVLSDQIISTLNFRNRSENCMCVDRYMHHLNDQMIDQMVDRTYYLLIICPQYGTNKLNKHLIKLLSHDKRIE
jgi:hypothetical protein